MGGGFGGEVWGERKRKEKGWEGRLGEGLRGEVKEEVKRDRKEIRITNSPLYERGPDDGGGGGGNLVLWNKEQRDGMHFRC